MAFGSYIVLGIPGSGGQGLDAGNDGDRGGDGGQEIAKKEIRPAEIALDQIADPVEAYSSDIFKGIMKKIYDVGFHKTGLPEEVGGAGLNNLGQLVVLEELAVGGAGLASEVLVLPIGPLFMGMAGLADRHKVYKDYLEAYVNLGSVFVKTDRYEEAVREFQRALTIQPDFAPARQNLERVQAFLRSN